MYEDLGAISNKAIIAYISRDPFGFRAKEKEGKERTVALRTPLHLAVIEGRSADSVQTLIDRACDVNAQDYDRFTPLHYAVESKNVDLIKCLIMNNASISFKEIRNDLTPLCSAMLLKDMTSVKALIKYGLLKDFEDDYSKVIDLQSYEGMQNYLRACSYLNQCGREILKMKEEKISDEVTLFQFIKSKHVPPESLYKDSKGMKLFTERSFEVITSNNYRHYNDVITEKLKNKLQVYSLRCMLSNVQISTADTDTKESEHMTLNPDINNVLADYLPKNDLFNLILASFEPCNYKVNQRDPATLKLQEKSLIEFVERFTASSKYKHMKLK